MLIIIIITALLCFCPLSSSIKHMHKRVDFSYHSLWKSKELGHCSETWTRSSSEAREVLTSNPATITMTVSCNYKACNQTHVSQNTGGYFSIVSPPLSNNFPCQSVSFTSTFQNFSYLIKLRASPWSYSIFIHIPFSGNLIRNKTNIDSWNYVSLQFIRCYINRVTWMTLTQAWEICSITSISSDRLIN